MSLDFDGSSYYLGDSLVDLRDPTTLTTGIVSGWFKIATAPAATEWLFAITPPGTASSRFSVTVTSAGVLLIRGQDVAGTGGSSILSVQSSSSVTDGSWHHFLCAWDVDTNANVILLIAGVNKTTLNFNGATEVEMRGLVSLGAKTDGTKPFTGQIYEMNLWHGFYLNPTTAANRRLFLSSEGDTDYATPGPTGTTRKVVGLGVYGINVGAEAIVLIGNDNPNNRARRSDKLVLQAGTAGHSSSNPKVYRESARRGLGRLGERWFDSEQSGFSYPRSETFIETREGLGSSGQRLGLDEKDATTRRERPSMTMSQLILSNIDREEDRGENR